jgi:hypothetical protein
MGNNILCFCGIQCPPNACFLGAQLTQTVGKAGPDLLVLGVPSHPSPSHPPTHRVPPSGTQSKSQTQDNPYPFPSMGSLQLDLCVVALGTEPTMELEGLIWFAQSQCRVGPSLASTFQACSPQLPVQVVFLVVYVGFAIGLGFTAGARDFGWVVNVRPLGLNLWQVDGVV